MPFIGIISDSKSENTINTILNKELSNDANIISINENSIENFKNIKFETILMIDNNSISKNHRELLKKIISNSKYLVLNADIVIDLELFHENSLKVITFGFNPKATITASSVEEEILLCIQRTISDINNHVIDQQEIKISLIHNKNIDINILIGIATVMLLYEKIGK